MQRPKVQLQGRLPLRVILPWILSFALTLSPVMAQNAAKPKTPEIKVVEIDRDEAVELARQRVLREPIPEPAPEGMPVLFNVPPADRAAASAFPTQGALPQAQPGGKKDKGIILAIIGGVAAAVLLALLLGGDDDEPEAGPVPTILTPGTPTVNPPSNP